MNQFEEMERLKKERKLLKPQVERQRRERMNRSLENLRVLLLQSPEQQVASQKRMEKAEILEHTVLFLQNSITETKKPRAEDESLSERHQFLDGFSVCLQKAAQFLQEESETQGLSESLSSSLYRCLSRPQRPGVRDVSHIAQGLQCVRRQTHTFSHPYRIPLRHTPTHSNTVLRQHNNNNNNNTAGTSRPTTITSPQSVHRQCVWRPWP
ncbi:hairy and enhancer of split related-7 [Silurus meridionalis]|nr:hairy and enhancer of split related-7 [Silurus meridionalis]